MKSIAVIFTSILLLIQITGSISINEIENVSGEISREITLEMSRSCQWPLYGHDARNTCLSEYNTSQNQGYEKWKYFVDAPLHLVAPVIDSDGILYITSSSDGLYAIYPNGTRKWHRELVGFQEYQPAIGPDGTIYAGTHERFHAFYPNGTLQWILPIKKNFCSQPVVSLEGIIYVGTYDGCLYALYPNGTIKWEYYIGYRIVGPSIDAEGNIYFQGIYDEYLYSLDANGSLRWTFYCIEHPVDAPLIGNDGTIYYVPTSWVIAINPDGSEKWRIPSNGMGRSPSISPDGTIIYSPSRKGKVFGIDPADGHILWTYEMGFNSWDKTRAAVGNDGTIYFAYIDDLRYKGYLSALNSDGTLKWTTRLTSDIYPYDGIYIGPNPSIGADGTVYVTTWFLKGGSRSDFGYVHAIGELDPNAPEAPAINGPISGKAEEQHEYNFKSTSPIGKDVYYFIDWDDKSVENWVGPCPSGVEIKVNHTWDKEGTYAIEARAKDTDDLCGPWGELEVTMPKNQQSSNSFFLRFLEHHPQAFPIIRHFLGLK